MDSSITLFHVRDEEGKWIQNMFNPSSLLGPIIKKEPENKLIQKNK